MTLSLADSANKLLETVTYSDRYPWPPIADRFGPSLERLCVSSDVGNAGNWIASPVPVDIDTHVEFGGSPGAPNHWALCPPFELTASSDIEMKFSEIMVHTAVLLFNRLEKLNFFV